MGLTSTGTPIYPGSTTFPGSSTFPGQGDLPQVEVLYSTDPFDFRWPTWTYAHYGVGGSAGTQRLRAYSVSRGRETEQQTVDAAVATIVLGDRDRAFDPNVVSALTPMNRWWIRVKFAGVTYDRFVGYAERYGLEWPQQGKDSIVTVSCVDEQKVLNLDALPTTDPPRDSYADLVLFDEPCGYWRMDDPVAATLAESAVSGPPWKSTGSGAPSSGTPGAIVGDTSATQSGAQYLILGSNGQMSTETQSEQSEFDWEGNNVGALEMWFNASARPAALVNVWSSNIDVNGFSAMSLVCNTTGTLSGRANNSAGTLFTATTTTSLDVNTWYHVVATISGGNLLIYLNGTLEATTAFTGTFAAIKTAAPGSAGTLGPGVAGLVTYRFDEVAAYNHELLAPRIVAHYQAGRSRGFAQQRSDERIGAVLDAAGSLAPRSFRAGDRNVAAAYMRGQPPLEEIQKTREVEAQDSVFFVSRSGAYVFLNAIHRSVSPWNTAQMVFDDDGTDFPYLDATQELSDSFVVNEAFVTRKGGNLEGATDATSRSKYGPRTQSITDLLAVSDVDAQAVADAIVAKYKDPMNRIPVIVPNMADAATAIEALERELGDRVRIIRRPLGGGAAIDQSPWIQKITESGKPGEPLSLSFNVSPV